MLLPDTDEKSVDSQASIESQARTSEIIDDSEQQAAEAALRQKTEAILDACKWRDIAKLRTLAESAGGFLADDLRGSVWPILLGLSPHALNGNGDTTHDKSKDEDSNDWKRLPRHRDEDQVQLDVNRSFIFYPNDKSEAYLAQCKSELSSLIVEVLRRHPYLCYFQGFHDICQVFLLVLQPAWRAGAVARLSVLRLRDFMLPSLSPTTAQLRLLPGLLAKADAGLKTHIATIEPFYALAGTLTMYAHNIEAYRDISRLFDVFLAREPVFTIYLFAQIVIDRREELLEIDEPDMLQVALAKVPPNLNLDRLIVNAVDLFNRFPPDSLASWRQISSASALKTARDVEACSKQTLEDGHIFFEQQEKEVRWLEMRDKVAMTLWRYRRPIKAFGMATAVALVAFYLRRNPQAVHYIMSLFTNFGKGHSE